MVIINSAILYFQKPDINHTCAHPVVECPNWKNLYFELNGSIVLLSSQLALSINGKFLSCEH